MKRNALFLLAFALMLFGYLNMPQAATHEGQATAKAVVQQRTVTPPKEHFGFNIGDDYCLANYKQLESYWKKIEKQTDRLKVVNMGKTEEGRDQLMGIVTSPANHAKLDFYKQIARKLARAEGVSAEEAARLAEEGKAVVWLDGGLHASEVLCAQVLIESMYRFVTATDPESLRILNDVIILYVHCNPDGMDLVADHYMRNDDPKQRSGQGLPRLYQKYIGHDNNRDFYANTQAETKNMNRVMYHEWYPQMVYNHHQTGPAGAVVFIPPCRDPFDYNIHPLVINGIEELSAGMVKRYIAEGMPGATVRTGAGYSTWFNGGLSTTCQFHNMIGIFTETIGGPTPSQVPLLPDKLLPKSDYLFPIAPQPWHFRQSLEYSVMGNKAVLDYASRNRSHLLKNIWVMGKDAIDKGNRDSWSIWPKIIEAAKSGGAKFAKGSGGAKDFERLFHDPAKRDPRGYIIPSDQVDFPTCTKFVNTLLGNGITMHRATADFSVAGKQYPAGSYVVKSAQAFRPHLLDMFEPQDHPNDFPRGSETPTPPYDAAGWTLAYQMAVKFDRILDGFDGPFEEIKAVVIAPAPAKVTRAADAVGFYLDNRMNDSFRAVNRLLAAKHEVRRLQEPFKSDGPTYAAGTFFIPKQATTVALLEKIATEMGTAFVGSTSAPGKKATPVKTMRVGLWDTKPGGSMPSGWTRWILEQFEFPYKVIYAADMEDTALRDKFDVLLFIEGGAGGGKGGGMGGGGMPQTSVGNLKTFLEAGGTVLTVGGSTGLGKQLGLPVEAHPTGGRDKFFVPTSVLQVKMDPKQPLTWGMEERVDLIFANSPTFKLGETAGDKGLTKLAWFDTKTPLRSGWAWGQQNLEGGIAMIDAKVGKGRLAMFGPSILYRGQPHGTFKLLFNGIVQAQGSEGKTGRP